MKNIILTLTVAVTFTAFQSLQADKVFMIKATQGNFTEVDAAKLVLTHLYLAL
jgi:hypothetical protein